jgi:1,4-dihydroxy-2-naphthoate octaprenyltransferase
MGWIGALPRMGALAVFLCSPLAIAIARYATEHEATPERLFKTKYLAVRWHAASSLAMAIGIWLDPWFPWVWTRVPGAALGLAYS